MKSRNIGFVIALAFAAAGAAAGFTVGLATTDTIVGVNIGTASHNLHKGDQVTITCPDSTVIAGGVDFVGG